MRKLFVIFIVPFFWLSCVKKPGTVENLWPSEIERYWVGPQFQSFPEMGWKLDSGKLVCLKGAGSRGVVMLTKNISKPLQGFEITFSGGFTDTLYGNSDKIGFVLGLHMPVNENVIFSDGLFTGVSASGEIYIAGKSSKLSRKFTLTDKLIFTIEGVLQKDEKLKLLLRVRNGEDDSQLGEAVAAVSPGSVTGLVAFFVQSNSSASGSAWFESLEITGEAIHSHPEMARGPIIKVDEKFYNNKLLLTVHLAPLVISGDKKVVLQIREKGRWVAVDSAPVTKSYAVNLSANNLSSTVNSYRVYVGYIDRYGSQKYSYYPGNIRR